MRKYKQVHRKYEGCSERDLPYFKSISSRVTINNALSVFRLHQNKLRKDSGRSEDYGKK